MSHPLKCSSLYGPFNRCCEKLYQFVTTNVIINKKLFHFFFTQYLIFVLKFDRIWIDALWNSFLKIMVILDIWLKFKSEEIPNDRNKFNHVDDKKLFQKRTPTFFSRVGINIYLSSLLWWYWMNTILLF